MTNRSYGQYCGLARALELVGDRWALLIVRDLLVGPRRFSELEQDLSGLSSSVLAARLKELEAVGVVQREVLPRPESGFHYVLTEFGRDLGPAVKQFARWGARALGPPQPGEVVTQDSLVMALRTIFRPEKAGGRRCGYEVRVGEAVVHVRVADARAEAAPGPLPEADMVIDARPGLRALLAGEITAQEALDQGLAELRGDPALFHDFAEMFRIDPPPGACGHAGD